MPTSIPALVVPQDVLDAHLQGYKKSEIAEIKDALAHHLRDAGIAFNSNVDGETASNRVRTAKLFVGGPGTGKSTFMRNQLMGINTKGHFFAKAEFDELIRSIESVDSELKKISQEEASYGYSMNINQFEGMVGHALERWVPGAKWIKDSLINFYANKGLSFCEETVGRNPDFDKFLNNLAGQNYAIDMFVFTAPQDVQIESTKQHVLKDKALPFTAEETKKQTAASVKNNMAFAKYANRLTYLWRSSKNADPVVAAVSDISGIRIESPAAFKAIDTAYAANKGPSLMDILEEHAKRKQTRMAHAL